MSIKTCPLRIGSILAQSLTTRLLPTQSNKRLNSERKYTRSVVMRSESPSGSKDLIDNPHTEIQPGSASDGATGGDIVYTGFGNGSDSF
jgi:hypothetical protein